MRAHAKTEVVVPRPQYPDGYWAKARGARVVSRKDARLLKIVAGRRAKTVRLELDPR